MNELNLKPESPHFDPLAQIAGAIVAVEQSPKQLRMLAAVLQTLSNMAYSAARHWELAGGFPEDSQHYREQAAHSYRLLPPELRKSANRPGCTGLSARWCPCCGDCCCPADGEMNDEKCPLHAAHSKHGEQYKGDSDG